MTLRTISAQPYHPMIAGSSRYSRPVKVLRRVTRAGAQGQGAILANSQIPSLAEGAHRPGASPIGVKQSRNCEGSPWANSQTLKCKMDTYITFRGQASPRSGSGTAGGVNKCQKKLSLVTGDGAQQSGSRPRPNVVLEQLAGVGVGEELVAAASGAAVAHPARRDLRTSTQTISEHELPSR